jgi:TolB-like protein/DNA-binding winged helix-turn-helix (wHTH) protein/Flp pilus assembly protein TadD
MNRQPQGYLFGDFEVSPDAAELRRGGEVVHLEPRVLALLVYLIEHRDRLVPKRELLDAVWEEAFVTENALTKAIGRLRKALDDDAQRPAYIHTHHTLGYRFIAEVEERRGPPAAVADRGADARRERRPARRIRVAATVGAAVVVAAVAVLIGLDRRRAGDRPAGGEAVPEIRSLAVLPLANLSSDPEHAYFAEGMQEALITDLARITSLRVVSRQSAMRFRDSEDAAPEIARRLGVDALVEGSVMRHGDRVGIWVNLIHGPSDRHLWSESYEREVENVLYLVNDVARTISGELEVALGGEEDHSLGTPRRVDPEAHDAYLRARHHLNQFTPEGMEKARRLFRTALDLDPTFAPAHSGLGYTHLIAMVQGRPPAETAPLARAAALRAIELDDDIAEAHAILGCVRLGFDWDWSGAASALRRALELNPSDAFARHGYADYLTALGRPEEGLEQVMIGRDCDPLSPLAHYPVLYHLFLLQRYDEVITESRKALELFPGWGAARRRLGWALFSQGRYEAAFAELRQDLGAAPAFLEALERGFAEAGPRGASRAVAELLAARAVSEYVDPLQIAGHFARAGDADRAIDWLEKAFENRSPLLGLIQVDPDFAGLRTDPRIAALVRRIGLPE